MHEFVIVDHTSLPQSIGEPFDAKAWALELLEVLHPTRVATTEPVPLPQARCSWWRHLLNFILND